MAACGLDSLPLSTISCFTYPPPLLKQSQVYPLIGISVVTFLLGAWFGPYYLYKSPEKQ